MDNSTLIIILAIILLILIALNHITIITNPTPIGGCAGTRYGCCPDNYTPKIDPQGTNCSLNPTPIPGGCAGTRYGCCPNGVTPKFDPQGSNCPRY